MEEEEEEEEAIEERIPTINTLLIIILESQLCNTSRLAKTLLLLQKTFSGKDRII
jgi:hypothetical protein